jgi:hypothetical protein
MGIRFQTSAVTCLTWPSQGPLIIGLADGKVRAAFIKNNKVSINLGAILRAFPQKYSVNTGYMHV